jgi:hypothetical protein
MGKCRARLFMLVVLIGCWPQSARAQCKEAEESVWPIAQDSRAETGLAILPVPATTTLPAATFCVVDIDEHADGERAQYALSGAAAWMLLTVPESECAAEGGQCSDEQLVVNDGLQSPSIMVGTSAGVGAEPTLDFESSPELVSALAAWLRSAHSPQPNLDDLVSKLWKAAGPPPADNDKAVTFWSNATPTVMRRLLIARSLTSACTITFSRKDREVFPPLKAAYTHWVARKAGSAPLEHKLASRTVRVSFKDSEGCRKNCTGYLLDSNVVLTAKHCLTPIGGSTAPKCAAPDNDCSTYRVEVDYRNGGQPRYSLPVHDAYGDPKLDFGLLYLKEHAGRVDLSPGRPEGEARARSTFNAPIDQEIGLLSHPVGAPLFYSNCSVDLGVANAGGREPDANFFAIHRCYTAGGSSGALVWVKDESKPRPVALHTNSFNECMDIRSQGTPALPKAVSDRVGALSLTRASCVNVGVRVSSIYQALCLDTERRRPLDCGSFLKGLVDYSAFSP